VRRLTFPLPTERLLLRPFTDDDLEPLHALQSREDVTRYLYWSPRSREQARELLERMKRMTAIDDDSDALRLAGVLKRGGALVGDFSLWRTSAEHNQAEIGFIVHPDFHGRGYATEAMRVVLGYGFENVGFHRIVGRCDARNERSTRLMERLGMRREAHLRENEFVKGEWTDELVYALLATEWHQRAGGGSA
jgi:RimJ/RimL family protein N-acetyltransferase